MIWLTQGQFTIVDDIDYDIVKQYKWYAVKFGDIFYAIANIKGTALRMHRLILGLTDSKILADHADRNGLNNQRYNLRVANNIQNNANSIHKKSKYKYRGVRWNIKNEKWTAQISYNFKTLYLGSFTNEEDAALAYNKKALELHGEFAKLNIIQ